jgi:hypothetical protein
LASLLEILPIVGLVVVACGIVTLGGRWNRDLGDANTRVIRSLKIGERIWKGDTAKGELEAETSSKGKKKNKGLQNVRARAGARGSSKRTFGGYKLTERQQE